MEQITIEVPKDKAEETIREYHENYVTFMTSRADIDSENVRITVTHFGKR